MNKRWKILFWSVFLLTLGPVIGITVGYFLEEGPINTGIPIKLIGFLLGLLFSYFLFRILRWGWCVWSVFLLTLGPVIGTTVGYFLGGIFITNVTPPTTLIGFLLGLLFSYFLFRILRWNWWAPNNFCYTFVGEGRAKIIIKGRAFNKTLIQWEGYTFDEEGKVTENNKRHKRKDDLHFYGFWPVYDVLGYSFSWKDEKKTHAERVIDYVLLKTAIYIISVEEVEDRERIPLNIDFLCQIRVENPYVAIFRIQGWLQAITARIKTKTREIVNTKNFEDWLQNSNEISKIIKEESTNEETGYYKQFGVSLELIEIKNINPSKKEDREAFSDQGRAIRQGEAIKVRAKAERDRIEMIAKLFSRKDVKFMRFLEALEKGNSNYVLPSDISEMIKGFIK